MSSKPAQGKYKANPGQNSGASKAQGSFYVLDDEGPPDFPLEQTSEDSEPTSAVAARLQVVTRLLDAHPRWTSALSAVGGLCLVGLMLFVRSRFPDAPAIPEPVKDPVAVSSPSHPLSKQPTAAVSSKGAERDPTLVISSLAASLQRDNEEAARLRARNRRLEAMVVVLQNRLHKHPPEKTK